MADKLTVEELGELIPCQACDAPTYDAKLLPNHPVMLPDGYTRGGNARHHVTVKGVRLVVCENCRYYKYGAY